MKTTLIRFVVVAFVLAAFGLLAFSPTRAQSSASSNNQDGPMGCCGNQNSQINCPSGYVASANAGNASCVKQPESSNNTTTGSSNTTFGSVNQ